jgi:hypothetical protein
MSALLRDRAFDRQSETKTNPLNMWVWVDSINKKVDLKLAVIYKCGVKNVAPIINCPYITCKPKSLQTSPSCNGLQYLHHALAAG